MQTLLAGRLNSTKDRNKKKQALDKKKQGQNKAGPR